MPRRGKKPESAQNKVSDKSCYIKTMPSFVFKEGFLGMVY